MRTLPRGSRPGDPAARDRRRNLGPHSGGIQRAVGDAQLVDPVAGMVPHRDRCRRSTEVGCPMMMRVVTRLETSARSTYSRASRPHTSAPNATSAPPDRPAAHRRAACGRRTSSAGSYQGRVARRVGAPRAGEARLGRWPRRRGARRPAYSRRSRPGPARERLRPRARPVGAREGHPRRYRGCLTLPSCCGHSYARRSVPPSLSRKLKPTPRSRHRARPLADALDRAGRTADRPKPPIHRRLGSKGCSRASPATKFVALCMHTLRR